jgi:hypothetical protein
MRIAHLLLLACDDLADTGKTKKNDWSRQIEKVRDSYSCLFVSE